MEGKKISEFKDIEIMQKKLINSKTENEISN